MYVENGILRLAVDKQKLEGQFEPKPPQNEELKRVELKNNAPIEPTVKNSWIYNKYFKDYKGVQENQEEEILLTKEQLREKRIKQYVEYVNARKRAAQVKSTKMLFSNNSVQQIDINTSQNNAKLNRLFRF